MIHNSKCSDNRRHARFELLEYALVYRPGAQEPERAVVVDVSLGGLQIRSRTKFPTGEPCTLVIGQGGEPPLKLSAETRYSHEVEDSELFATGFLFRPDSAEERGRLVNYIHDAFQRRGEILLS